MKKLLLILLCLPMIGLGQMNEGEDSSRCLENCTLTREYCKKKMYADALNHWRWAFNNCPKSTENIYRDGIIIYKDLMNQATANKQAYIDTLNLIYDTRIKYFKQAPYGKEELLTLNPEAIQELDEYDIEDILVVETAPEFPGGSLGLMRYLQKNIKYPPLAKEYNIQGKVYVSYMVEKDGSVDSVKVVRGVDKNLDAEAIRVVKSLPKYKPGTQRGKAVRVMFTIPINFTLTQ